MAVDANKLTGFLRHRLQLCALFIGFKTSMNRLYTHSCQRNVWVFRRILLVAATNCIIWVSFEVMNNLAVKHGVFVQVKQLWSSSATDLLLVLHLIQNLLLTCCISLELIPVFHLIEFGLVSFNCSLCILCRGGRFCATGLKSCKLSF